MVEAGEGGRIMTVWKGKGKWEGSDRGCNGRRKEMEEDWERSVIICEGCQEMKQEQMGECKWGREYSSTTRAQLQRGWNWHVCLIKSSICLWLWEQGYVECGLWNDLESVFQCGNCHLLCSSWFEPCSPDRMSYANRWEMKELLLLSVCLTPSLDHLAEVLTSCWGLQHLAKNT